MYYGVTFPDPKSESTNREGVSLQRTQLRIRWGTVKMGHYVETRNFNFPGLDEVEGVTGK